MEQKELVVLGGGPAAVAAASALLDRGAQVSLLEAGLRLEHEQEVLQKALAVKQPSDWTPNDLAPITGKTRATTKGVPQKLVHGSDFPFRTINPATSLEVREAKVLRSFATGGLSNVWGACILPYPKHELDAWPLDPSELDAHYAAVLALMPHSGAAKEDPHGIPRYSENYQPLELSNQARTFLDDLRRSASSLRSRGIEFFQARLAVDAAGSGGCRYCGMCLYGCPWNLIYSAAHSLPGLTARGLEHISGLWVDYLEEHGDSVRIHCRNVSSGESEVLSAKKVFLATGFVESTRILLKSQQRYNTPTTALHSDRFTLPFFRFRSEKNVAEETLHTLCQLYLELTSPSLGERSVHLQLYTYSDLFQKALDARLGPLRKPLRLLTTAAATRLFIFFGYLHSDVSSRLRIELVKTAAGEQLKVSGEASPQAKRISWRVAQLLGSTAHRLRGLPAAPMMDQPGGGN
ncbi:MAG: GMC family oxidoreductase N-terminal domain-containing protein, partial [Bdellovibrionales bacterium]|nr:GMC family oxidoreductase N-terminal domain-containing protein [Bdellovibrionales bacterium]